MTIKGATRTQIQTYLDFELAFNYYTQSQIPRQDTDILMDDIFINTLTPPYFTQYSIEPRDWVSCGSIDANKNGSLGNSILALDKPKPQEE